MDRDIQILTTEFHELLGAFDQINDSILIIDPATEQIINANNKAVDLFGYSKEEFRRLKIADITKDYKQCREHMFEVISGSSSKRFESVIILKDRTTRLIENSPSVVTYNNRTAILCIGRDIEDKRRTELKLKDSENQLYLMFENAPIGKTLTTIDGKLLRVNRAFAELLGYTKEELLEMDFFTLTHTDDLGYNQEVINNALKNNKDSFELEKRYVRKDGKIIYAHTHATIIKDDDGKPYRYVGQIINITKQKEDEKKLKATEHHLSALLNNLNDIVFYESDTDGVFMSDNVEDMLGYTAGEFANDKNLFESLMNIYDRERINKMVRSWQVHENPGTLKFEFRVRKKDGSYIWVDDHMFGVKTDNRSFWSGYMIDITERKKTEQRLEETQMRLAAVLNNLPNVVFYENAYGKQFISENIMEMLGYPVEEFYDNPGLFDSLIDEDDLRTVIKQTDSWYNSGAKGTYKEVFRIKRKDGNYIWLEDHMFKSQRQDGDYYYSGVMIDISERKKIEGQIQDSLREKELLIKEIHHRVKNNLQVISSMLKLQSVHIKDNDALDMLIDSQNRVQSMALVHQKLYLSKDLANVDLNDYVNQLLIHIFNSVKFAHGNIKLEVNVDKIKVGVDTAIPCGLILNELVTNSLKHAYPDNAKGTVSVSVKSSGAGLYELVIKNDGVDFPVSIDYKNTESLGLQLVNTLVNQLEGTIDLKRGNGTEFIITFKNIG